MAVFTFVHEDFRQIWVQTQQFIFVCAPFVFSGVWTPGSGLQPWVQPLELRQVLGRVAARGEGGEWVRRCWVSSRCGCIYRRFPSVQVPALFGIDTRMLTKVIRDKVKTATCSITSSKCKFYHYPAAMENSGIYRLVYCVSQKKRFD